MRRRWYLLSLSALLLTGCVTKSEFEAYKADIKADGEALDTWVAAAHTNIIWLRNMVVALCQATNTSCDPPAAPPSPPPDGDWGAGS